ncbi:hypothetical protein ACLQ3B_02805 [Micromonospora sp. DT53]|uniref:hypothetical protein n=1 Tax=Micromonospora sp. DT53 TaxID=3393444 RepID=UPI003CEF50E7
MTGGPDPVIRDGGELDGFHIGYLPPDVGDLVSDFASEWEDVTVATRVWERQVEDGHRVDLRVHVLRGDRLGTLTELRDFLAEYHERDNADWALTDFQHGEDPGLIGAAEAFWLAERATCYSIRSGSPRTPCGRLRSELQQPWQIPSARRTWAIRSSAEVCNCSTATSAEHEGPADTDPRRARKPDRGISRALPTLGLAHHLAAEDRGRAALVLAPRYRPG